MRLPIFASLICLLAASVSAQWAVVAKLPSGRSDAAVASVNGRLCVIGGTAGRSVDIYDPRSGQWSRKAGMPTRRWGAAACTVGSMIYGAGGWDGARVHDTVERYDVTEDRWDAVTSMPTARGWLSLTAVDGIIYAIGGETVELDVFDFDILDTVEAFDPTTGEWTERESMAEARNAHGAATLDGRMYIVGGWGSGGAAANPLDTMEIYDPETDRWEHGPDVDPMPEGGRSALSASTVGPFVYAIGGRGFDDLVGFGQRTNLDRVERFDVRSQRWQVQPPLNVPQRDHSSVVIRGVIYVAGGSAWSVERFDTGLAVEPFDGSRHLATTFGAVKRGAGASQ